MSGHEEGTGEVRECSLRLRDGRRLAYVDIGPPDGTPILCCHGTPGSRLEFRPDAPHAALLGIRLIAPDRPGYGRSEFRRGSLLDWAADATELLDALDLPQAAVLGVSGGVSWALALAYCQPERVRRLGLVSGAAIFPGITDVPARFRLSRRLLLGWAPWPLVRMCGTALAAFFRGDPADAHRVLLAAQGLPHGLETTEGLPATYLEQLKEPYLHGGAGLAADWRLTARGLPFRPQAFMVDTFLWHGGRDRVRPVAMARALARAIPGCHIRVYHSEGHDVLLAHWREILGTLAEVSNTQG